MNNNREGGGDAAEPATRAVSAGVPGPLGAEGVTPVADHVPLVLAFCLPAELFVSASVSVAVVAAAAASLTLPAVAEKGNEIGKE